jgi:hypothetical protein
VPAALSISYLIGSPPTGTSMMTLISWGGFLPMEMASTRMTGVPCGVQKRAQRNRRSRRIHDHCAQISRPKQSDV